MEMLKVIENLFLATLGIVALAYEKTQKTSRELIEKGQILKEKAEEKIQETFGKTFPTKKDIEEINKKLEELSRKLEHI
ncbi:MAG: hypothetical protein H5T85_06150 [Actinobacteria bacterium]|nr:hypothetical protein [Actinomycetota bacterium]